MTGFVAETAYAIALCYYQQKAYGPALKHIAEIIEKGVREHPELSVGSQTEGVEVREYRGEHNFSGGGTVKG